MSRLTLDHSLIGEVINDEYVIEELLGAGGMGTAYGAIHRLLQRKVCIKFLEVSALSEAKNIRRFRREAKVLGRLSHPNIVTCYSFGVYKNVYPYLVMELLEGQSLRQALSSGPMEPIRACRIVEQICKGLQFAHNAGFAHRDVKPDNVMLQGTGDSEIAKLVDFGLVGKNTKDVVLDTITVTGQVVGTPLYMAPEAFSGTGEGKSLDIYATGCVLYECLAGVVPFQADSLGTIMRQHAQDDVPPLPRTVVRDSIRKLLDSVIKRATEKVPSKRFKECSELQKLLHAASLSLAGQEETSPLLETALADLERETKEGPAARPMRILLILLTCSVVFGTIVALQSSAIRNSSANFSKKDLQATRAFDPEQTPLTGSDRLLAADKLLVSGCQKKALELLNYALSDASRSQNATEWCMLMAKLARIKAESGNIAQAQRDLSTIFDSPNWKKTISEAPKYKANHSIVLIEGLTDLNSAIMAVGKPYARLNQKDSLRTLLDQLGQIVLAGGELPHYIEYGSLMQLVHFLNLDSATIHQVMERAPAVLSESKIPEHRFWCARAYFQYALLLWKAHKFGEARTSFQQGTNQTEKGLTLWRQGRVVNGSEPLGRVLHTFDSTDFQKDASILIDKITMERTLRSKQDRSKANQAETGIRDGENPTSRR
jgi:serine/threonine protein kinase